MDVVFAHWEKMEPAFAQTSLFEQRPILGFGHHSLRGCQEPMLQTDLLQTNIAFATPR